MFLCDRRFRDCAGKLEIPAERHVLAILAALDRNVCEQCRSAPLRVTGFAGRELYGFGSAGSEIVVEVLKAYVRFVQGHQPGK